MKWVKLYTSEWIDGSIRIDLTPAERSMWADLLVLAGLSRREGYIERSQGIPFTVQDIASRCVVDISLVNSTIEKCKKEGRITIDEANTIIITNWEKYQFVPDGKSHMAETKEERKLRELRTLLRLQRNYPEMAITERTEVITEKGEVVSEKKVLTQVVSNEGK